MRFNMFRSAAAAAVLITAAAGGQALAQDHSRGGPDHGGAAYRDYDGDRDFGGRGDHRFNDGDYGRFSDNDFGAQGRFYQGGDVRARFERLQHFIRFQARTGRINRWEARRAEEMLQSVRWQSRQFRRDGVLSRRERQILNVKLDRVVSFLRQARRDHDDPRDQRRH